MVHLEHLLEKGQLTQVNGVNSNFVVDFSGKYHLKNNLSITGSAINLFNNTYVAAKAPAGLRPGHPFGVYGGLEYRF